MSKNSNMYKNNNKGWSFRKKLDFKYLYFS